MTTRINAGCARTRFEERCHFIRDTGANGFPPSDELRDVFAMEEGGYIFKG